MVIRRKDGGTLHGSGSIFFFPFPVWFVVLHLQLVKLHGRNVQLGVFAKLVSIWVKPEVLEGSLLGRVGDSHEGQSFHYSPFNCGGSLGTPFQEQGPKPLPAGTVQSNNLKAGPPPAAWQPLRCSVSCHCPALASSNAVLSCQQRSTCFSAGPHQSLGSAPSRMLTTCFVRCPACLRNGTMKRHFPSPVPWGFCCWILSAVCSLQSLHAASLAGSPCQLPAAATAPLQPSLPPGILYFPPLHR